MERFVTLHLLSRVLFFLMQVVDRESSYNKLVQPNGDTCTTGPTNKKKTTQKHNAGTRNNGVHTHTTELNAATWHHTRCSEESFPGRKKQHARKISCIRVSRGAHPNSIKTGMQLLIKTPSKNYTRHSLKQTLLALWKCNKPLNLQGRKGTSFSMRRACT